MKIKVVLEKFVANLQAKKRSISTILAYKKDIEQLIEKTGNKEISKITAAEIEKFKKDLTREGYTAKSISRKVNALKSFFRFSQANKLIQSDPSLTVTHPKYEINPPRILTKVEYRALRDACRADTRMSAIIEILLQTGVRIGELSRLKLTDVKPKKGLMQISPYESQKNRQVPFNPAAERALKQYLAIRPQSKNETLFLTKTGKPFLVRNIRSAINRYFRLAGIKDARVNDLRHTFIVHQLKAGIPLITISQLVGHKRISTTEKYLEFIEEKNPARIKLEEL